MHTPAASNLSFWRPPHEYSLTLFLFAILREAGQPAGRDSGVLLPQTTTARSLLSIIRFFPFFFPSFPSPFFFLLLPGSSPFSPRRIVPRQAFHSSLPAGDFFSIFDESGRSFLRCCSAVSFSSSEIPILRACLIWRSVSSNWLVGKFLLFLGLHFVGEPSFLGLFSGRWRNFLGGSTLFWSSPAWPNN